jgi:hypothetical protein
MSWGLYAGAAAGFFCIVYLFTVNGRLNEKQNNKCRGAYKPAILDHLSSPAFPSRYRGGIVRKFDIHAKPVRWLGFSVDCKLNWQAHIHHRLALSSHRNWTMSRDHEGQQHPQEASPEICLGYSYVHRYVRSRGHVGGLELAFKRL